MKKTLLLLCAFIASAGAWAQNITTGKTVVPLGGLKTYTAEDGVMQFTISNADLQKITVEGNTANVYLFPETGGNWNTEANKAIGIQGFYIDLGASKTIGLIQTTWEGAAAGGTVYVTNTEPASDGTLTGTTAIATLTNAQETAKNATVDVDNSGRYIVFVPTEATNWGWGVKIRTFSAIEKYVPVLTTLNATASTTTLNVGGTAAITTSALDQNGVAVEDAVISYESSNPSVATVAADGTVTAVSLGTATITVKANKGAVELTKDIDFIVEEPFLAPASIATAPTAAAENVIAIFSQTYGKVGAKDNNAAWGGGPNPLWTSHNDIDISDHTLKHVVGTGYGDRPAEAITAEYTKAFVALYPKSATTGKLYADGAYAEAESFALTPKTWNYIEVPFAKATNYVMVELVGETEFYLDHFYVTKPAAGSIEVTVSANGVAKVAGTVNNTNLSQVISQAGAAPVIDFSAATVAEAISVSPANPNAIVVVKGTGRVSEQTVTASNLVVYQAPYYRAADGVEIVYTDNDDYQPNTAFVIDAKEDGFTITRNVAAGKTVTAVFPAAATISGEAEIYEFADADNDAVAFNLLSGTTIPAGTPVIVKTTGATTITATAKNDLNLTAAPATAAINGVTFQGNYAQLATDGTQYVLQANKLYPANGVQVGAFRAYFTGLKAASARVVLNGGETTGIADTLGQGTDTQRYYNLQGVQVAQPTKGLYIVNGKKIIVK